MFSSASSAEYIRFQSTRPVRGATFPPARRHSNNRFQSTRPVRGATNAGGKRHYHDRVSIHAPREGRDTST